MTLLFVTDNGFCNENGQYYFSAPNLAHINNLSAFFDSFIVVARDDTFANGYQIVPNNIEIHLVHRYSVLKLIHVLRKLIDRCDAVMCYGTNGYFAAKIGHESGKTVISYNGGDPYDFCISRGTLKGKLLAPLARYLCKKSFEYSDYGHYCDEFLFDRYPAKKKMLACSGVDIECDIRNLDKRIKKISSMNNDHITIGLIGHTKNNLKGIDIAIQAMAKLNSNYYLEVVGRGDIQKYIELSKCLGCEDRISFKGALPPGEELMTWLDEIDIYIQPSRIEGLPRATIEAMSRACPVVASNAGALNKLVDESFIFTLDNSDSLYKLIDEISDKEVLIDQAKKNYDKSKKYERSVRDKKYYDFYSGIVSEIEKKK